jgi:hypothetical protein
MKLTSSLKENFQPKALTPVFKPPILSEKDLLRLNFNPNAIVDRTFCSSFPRKQAIRNVDDNKLTSCTSSSSTSALITKEKKVDGIARIELFAGKISHDVHMNEKRKESNLSFPNAINRDFSSVNKANILQSDRSAASQSEKLELSTNYRNEINKKGSISEKSSYELSLDSIFQGKDVNTENTNKKKNFFEKRKPNTTEVSSNQSKEVNSKRSKVRH